MLRLLGIITPGCSCIMLGITPGIMLCIPGIDTGVICNIDVLPRCIAIIEGM
jgi:hypothetical protein